MKILPALILSLVSVGLVGSGCASDESAEAITSGRSTGTTDSGLPNDSGNGNGSNDAGTTTGSCNPQYCPEMGGGVGCCVTANGPCGVDFGTGCVGTMPDGG